MIASDLNNPEFVGAINPDSRLAVQFYTKPVQNEFQSNLQKRPIFENVDFVKIWTPGNILNIIDTYVRDEHKERFPRQWAAYQNRVGEDTRGIGTPISEWTRITQAQAEELKALKFFTVESIASAGDAQLQGIGMIAGQSVFAFRDDAKRFLMVADAAAKLSEADERVKKMEDEMARKEAEHMQKIEKMQLDMREEMRQQIAELASAAQSAAPKKRGRKPRAEAAQ